MTKEEGCNVSSSSKKQEDSKQLVAQAFSWRYSFCFFQECKISRSKRQYTP